MSLSDALQQREFEDDDRELSDEKLACYITLGLAIEYPQEADRGEVVEGVFRDLREKYGRENVDNINIEDGWWPTAGVKP